LNSTDSVPRSIRLKGNTIGPWGLAALAIGITSPAMGLYALWAPMQVAAGPITPLIFLAAMVMILPTAISYALLNREAPSAAAASAWVWKAVHPIAGFQAGLLMTTYFFIAALAQPLMFALFFHDLLEQLHVHLPQSVTLTLGVLAAGAPVAWVCLRGAEAFVAHPPPGTPPIGMDLNLDMLSRSDGADLTVSGVGPEPWLRATVEAEAAVSPIHVHLGHDRPWYRAGMVEDWTDGSDHGAFAGAGIPWLYLGVEDHPDYHAPTDTFERIDRAFYADVASFVVSLVARLDRDLDAIAAHRRR